MNISEFCARKDSGHPLVCVTAYDTPFAHLAEEAGVDAILVGDSVGRTTLGYENELSVIVDDMAHHTAAVKRGAGSTLVIADLPFMSYATPDDALRNAATLVQIGGADAVKLEGGSDLAGITELLVNRGFAVMAHVGLTPQTAHMLGGYRLQGAALSAAQAIVDDANAQATAGAFAVVLEMLPARLAKSITSHVAIPTIGIGAGPGCDGQIQVLHDLLGFSSPALRHTRVFADVAQLAEKALSAYAKEVRAGTFPTEEQSFRGNRGVVDRITFE